MSAGIVTETRRDNSVNIAFFAHIRAKSEPKWSLSHLILFDDWTKNLYTNKASVDSAAPISFGSTRAEGVRCGCEDISDPDHKVHVRPDADRPEQMTALVGRSVYNVDIVLLLLQCGFVLRAPAAHCAQALLPYTDPP